MMYVIHHIKYDFCLTFVILVIFISMKRSKNLKITPMTHKILKDYCEENGLKMFGFVEKLIKEACKKPTDIYGDPL